MDSLLDKLPNAENIVAWVVYLAATVAFIKYQINNLMIEQKEIKEHLTDQKTDIAVIKEQVTSVKAKIENGLSHNIKETSERVARIEGACQACEKHK